MKKLTTILLLLVFVLTISACGSTQQANDQSPSTAAVETEPPFDLAAFRESINECRASINDASVYVANMGTYEYNYMKALGKISDNAAEKAFEWLAKQTDMTKETVESSYEAIRQQYKNISLTEPTGAEAEKIFAEFETMYQSYVTMYDLVMTPSGSVDTFAVELSGYIESIQKSESELALFLD